MIPERVLVEEAVRSVARDELLPRFARTESRYKADGSVVTEADFAVQQRLERMLATLAPDIPLLGEEMSEFQQRELFEENRRALWCLDPLDGTGNFVSGIPFFSVSLALLGEKGPILGVVYDPVRDECFSATTGHGAWLNGSRLMSNPVDLPLSRCIAIVDTKRLGPQGGTLVADPPYRSQRSFGSGALEWCWLAAHRGQVYLHGRQQLWDYAAGWLILMETGGRASSLDGNVTFADDIAPRSVVAACDPVLYDEFWSYLRLHHPALVAGG